MKRRDPLDRAIDFAFGVPIAATAFMREATRIAAHAIADSRSPSSSADEPVAEVASSTRQAETSSDGPAVPFDGYDSMDARELLARIETLDADALAAVEAYESEHRRRRTVLVKLAATRRASTP